MEEVKILVNEFNRGEITLNTLYTKLAKIKENNDKGFEPYLKKIADIRTLFLLATYQNAL